MKSPGALGEPGLRRRNRRRAALIACFTVIQVHHVMDSNDRRFRKATYPMSIEDKDELAQEFAEFGYRETSDPNDADRRNFYKVEKSDAAELHVEALIHASNDLQCAKAIFASERNRRPRGRYTLRQGIRVLERWPPR